MQSSPFQLFQICLIACGNLQGWQTEVAMNLSRSSHMLGLLFTIALPTPRDRHFASGCGKNGRRVRLSKLFAIDARGAYEHELKPQLHQMFHVIFLKQGLGLHRVRRFACWGRWFVGKTAARRNLLVPTERYSKMPFGACESSTEWNFGTHRPVQGPVTNIFTICTFRWLYDRNLSSSS